MTGDADLFLLRMKMEGGLLVFDSEKSSHWLLQYLTIPLSFRSEKTLFSPFFHYSLSLCLFLFSSFFTHSLSGTAAAESLTPQMTDRTTQLVGRKHDEGTELNQL